MLREKLGHYVEDRLPFMKRVPVFWFSILYF